MKAITVFVIAGAVILGLTAGLVLTDPETTVETFFEAMANGDADTAAECIEGGMNVREKEEFVAIAPYMSEFYVTVTGSDIYVGTAVVYIEMTFEDDSDTDQIDMVNVNGDWLIVME